MDTETQTDAQPAAGSPDPNTDQLMDAASARITELEGQLQEMRDRWMRGEAEMANVRARAKREVDEARQYGLQKFAGDVVEAAENLRRGLASLPPPTEGEPEIVSRLREGFAGIERSFIGLLERNGIKGQEPVGAMFDPNLHQAMGEEATHEHPSGTILKAWTSVWTLNGRLIRPAMVIVAKTAVTGPAVDTTA